MTVSNEKQRERALAWLRLKKVRDFSYVFKQGKRYHTDHVSLFIAKTKNEETRLGVTVKRKLVGSVGRNCLKRWLREAARLEGQRRKAGYDVVLMAKVTPTDTSSQIIRNDVKQLFAKAKILETL